MSRSANVAVADLRLRSKALVHVFSGDGREISLQPFRCDDFDRSDPAAFVRFGVTLIQGSGYQLKALILLVDAHGDSADCMQCLSLEPVGIFRITEGVASAHAVPTSWEKYQLIDLESGALFLIERRHGFLVSATPVPWSRFGGDLLTVAAGFRAMGFERIALVACPNDSARLKECPGAYPLSTQALLSASLNALRTRPPRDGTHVWWDDSDRAVFSVHSRRDVTYDIVHVKKHVFALAEAALAEAAAGRPVLFVVDQHIQEEYGHAIDEYSRRLMDCVGKMVFRAREARKGPSAVNRVCRFAASVRFPRHGVLVAVGGGVTLDVVGFAASVYRRGIGYFRIPTTLVGLIDAGLGIKQAVNFAGKKSLIGAFYPPMGVISDASFLRSLPLSEISCGLAEITKIALTRDRTLFEQLQMHGRELYRSRFSAPPEAAHRILYQAALVMLHELQPNLYEQNLRRVVDFGHTFSPLIEAVSGYEIRHGFAVATDMILSTAIAVSRGLCAPEVLRALLALVHDVGLPAALPALTAGQLHRAIESATQHRGGKLNLVVPTRIGQATFIDDVSADDIACALALIRPVAALT